MGKFSFLLKKSGWVLALLTSPVFAFELPEGSVDRYRIDSGYGPRTSILSPIHPQDSKISLSLGGAYSPFSSLIDGYGMSATMSYHVSRIHSWEIVDFSYFKTSLSSFSKQRVADRITDAQRASNSVEAPLYSFASMYLFSPYYSKMHITERSVVHFDVYAGAGPVFSKNEPLFLNETRGSSLSRYGLRLKTGMRFWLQGRWALKFEIADSIHTMTDFGKSSLHNQLQLNLGLSIFFGDFPEI